MKMGTMTRVGGRAACRVRRRRNRVITASTPRMTAENSTNTEPRPSQRAVNFHGLEEIVRAGRGEAAAGGRSGSHFEHGIENALVNADRDADGVADQVRDHVFLRGGEKGPSVWPV